ncbi:MAG: multiheme c-type cytochrome [Sulfurimonas sp.]
MRLFQLFTICSVFLFSGHHFESSEKCKDCHPIIYEEFKSTQHANASIFGDEIHAAVWKKHPKNIKFESYGCAKCHTPAADNYNALVEKNNGVVPDSRNVTQREGVSCAYCHRIESIEDGKISNTNIISKEEKKYFGTMKEHLESPFHKVRTDSIHFDNGNVCVGCHSHKQNKFGLNVCSTNINNELDGTNCVSCHMPKVAGSVSNFRDTKEHAFHGFPGTHTHREMLSRYVDLGLTHQGKRFAITINNKSSHALSLHPMRVMQLRVKVKREGKDQRFEARNFARIIGADGKPMPPWKAKEEVENSAIKAYEKREVVYDYALKEGDVVVVELGYYLVNPKLLKGLELQKNKAATTFYSYKKETFMIEK